MQYIFLSTILSTCRKEVLFGDVHSTEFLWQYAGINNSSKCQHTSREAKCVIQHSENNRAFISPLLLLMYTLIRQTMQQSRQKAFFGLRFYLLLLYTIYHHSCVPFWMIPQLIDSTDSFDWIQHNTALIAHTRRVVQSPYEKLFWG